MIFASVGTQLPFPRLMRALAEVDTAEDICAQIGEDEATYPFDTHRFLKREDYRHLTQSARVLVAHAGMGSVLTAMQIRKPLILMPRRAHLGEHRTDHQIHTVDKLHGRDGLYIAHSTAELRAHLAGPLSPASSQISAERQALVQTLRAFVMQQRAEG